MYRDKDSNNELKSEKCFSCKHCVWNEDLRKEVCERKWCYDGSNYEEFKLGE